MTVRLAADLSGERRGQAAAIARVFEELRFACACTRLDSEDPRKFCEALHDFRAHMDKIVLLNCPPDFAAVVVQFKQTVHSTALLASEAIEISESPQMPSRLSRWLRQWFAGADPPSDRAAVIGDEVLLHRDALAQLRDEIEQCALKYGVQDIP